VDFLFGINRSATSLLEKVHTIDPRSMDGMDLYAYLLSRSAKNSATLGALAQELLATDASKPEAWVAAACYAKSSATQDGKSTALKLHARATECIERAIALDVGHFGAYVFGGCLALDGSTPDPQEALKLFRRAYDIRKKDTALFDGMVRANLLARDYKGALLAAREALTLMPRNPWALVMVGRVLAANHEGVAKAEKAFLKAINFSPSHCEVAVIHLAKLYKNSHRLQEAVDILSAHVASCSNADDMHALMGAIYHEMRDYNKAMQSYHSALSINGACTAAKDGIANLEDDMKNTPSSGMPRSLFD
jgi:tetratricopeptide (TPR) repeat protein